MKTDSRPTVGVLLLDSPRYDSEERECLPSDPGLDDRPPGFVSNPSSWGCRTHFKVARGWSPEASASATSEAERALRAAARHLDGRVDVITTNCAYAWFSRAAFDAVHTPVLESGVALVELGSTASRDVALVVSHGPTVRNLFGTLPAGVRLVELDTQPEWRRFHEGAETPEAPLSQTRMGEELEDQLREDIAANGAPGVAVLECSGLPQFSSIVRRTYRRPVLDLHTALHSLLGLPVPRWETFPT